MVYLAGEASADTRTLVEDYLQIDEGLACEVEVARAAPLGAAAAPDLAPNSEKTALDATRNLLKERTSTLVIAVLFTALPLAFVAEGSHLSFVLIRDAPTVGLAWWLTAAIMWVWYARVRRRLRVSGL